MVAMTTILLLLFLLLLLAVVVLLLVVVILVVVVEVAIGMLQRCQQTPHQRKHPISIPRPWPHHVGVGGGGIRDHLRSADPRSDVVRGGVHGDRPNLVFITGRGCGGGQEGVSLGLSLIQGMPRQRPYGLGLDAQDRCCESRGTHEGYPDLFVSALLGGGGICSEEEKEGGGHDGESKEEGGGNRYW